MRLLLTLTSLAALPMVGLLSLPAAAAPTSGVQGSSPGSNIAQVQYMEIEPDVPSAPDDDVGYGFQADAVSRCAAQFRSFEPSTGYYTTYDGQRVLCPYLQ